MINQIKVLMVEDESALSGMYKKKFETSNCEIRVANNGLDAMVMIKDFKPDVILLDIMMPDIDGFETLKVIKQQTSLNSKIIVFSNLSNHFDIKLAKDLGADDYIVKASTVPKDIVKRVFEIMGREYPPADNTEHINIWIPWTNKKISISMWKKKEN